MSPTVFIILGIFFGASASLLLVTSVAADYWEIVTYDMDAIQSNPNLMANDSILLPNEGFYKVVLKNQVPVTDNGSTVITFYLRDIKGGIWRFCDRTSDVFRRTNIYTAALASAKFLKYTCFNYITQYSLNKAYLAPNAYSLVRMQNSAASCQIVALLCLVAAAVTGAFSLWQKQVSACMVTGVMYIVSGVFLCFALVIMLTKIGYMRTECYSVDPITSTDLCNSRTINVGWCVPLAWVAFSFFLVSCLFWQFLARCMRLEKSKAMI